MLPTLAAINVLLFLLPGFLALRIGERLTGRREDSQFDRVAVTASLTLIIIALYAFLAATLGTVFPVISLQETAEQVSIAVPQISPPAVGILLVITLIVGAGYGVYQGKESNSELDTWTRAFREVQVVKTGQGATGLWMRVHLNDGTQIIGWPKFWRPQEVFITDAEIYDRSGKSLGEIKSPGGLLLTERTPITYIAFVDTTE